MTQNRCETMDSVAPVGEMAAAGRRAGRAVLAVSRKGGGQSSQSPPTSGAPAVLIRPRFPVTFLRVHD